MEKIYYFIMDTPQKVFSTILMMILFKSENHKSIMLSNYGYLSISILNAFMT